MFAGYFPATGRWVPCNALLDAIQPFSRKRARKIVENLEICLRAAFIRSHPLSGFGMTAPQSLQVRCSALPKNRFMTGDSWLTMSSSSKRSS